MSAEIHNKRRRRTPQLEPLLSGLLFPSAAELLISDASSADQVLIVGKQTIKTLSVTGREVKYLCKAVDVCVVWTVS